MTTWGYLGLQDSMGPLMEQMIFFHDHVMVVVILIVTFVGFIMGSLFLSEFIDRFSWGHQVVGTVWTILPAAALVLIAYPSLHLLYMMDEVGSPGVTLKCVGHQWYWSYEYADLHQVAFNSYMIPSPELGPEGFRLLDVNNRVVLPMDTQIRILVTSADVIHSWAVPALGVKVDAIPGYFNQASFVLSEPGLYYGQCTEICGGCHSFMPIVIESVDVGTYLSWASSMEVMSSLGYMPGSWMFKSWW